MDTSILILTILFFLFMFCFFIFAREAYQFKKRSVKHMQTLLEKKMEITEKLEELKNYHFELTKKEEDFKKMGKQIIDNAKYWENLKKSSKEQIVRHSKN
ncbi:hypothetical protein [Chryseobacterium hispalense]|uniref:hypothetical protein n=1 Tax=Chryseobacterium hispalense TaxID=1453492 RepID=UPI0012FC2E3E|nr:hypothetical protein [Chryseobacterium hispalense]